MHPALHTAAREFIPQHGSFEAAVRAIDAISTTVTQLEPIA